MGVNFKLEAFKSCVINKLLLDMKEKKKSVENSSMQFMKSQEE